MRAVADDQQAAMVQGITVNRIFALAWALAGGGGGHRRCPAGRHHRSYELRTSQGFALLVFPVVILGGLDSVLGTVVGGVIVGLLVRVRRSATSTSGASAGTSPSCALVLILLVKPYGLFGQVRIERV